ncbi:MAG: 2-amino-4-hydroxy-6-hydroxymethyldihydropteridine diphosphokinase [Sediminibacterium sp.]|nr:2-amino-4-hydroxy-6-hydroxymethyldihydropteridine diphosphokinase [Sediminibacterium sp.]MDP3127208.1 2-amino-4-hydroxy-6-hydroxymethyldihydropteridine diphosphokinase [Sediminibacterium sp.]
MKTAYLLIGGNLGNRYAYLQKAVSLIQQFCGKIVHSSGVYETAAWGKTDQPAFYNQAIALETALSPNDLMLKLLEIETVMGRERKEKLGPRIIDLDILLIDHLILATTLLQVPHPALPFRRFALLPLFEIAPKIIHPILHKTIAQLLADCSDELDVQKKSSYPT